jgi:hypothetical protein
MRRNGDLGRVPRSLKERAGLRAIDEFFQVVFLVIPSSQSAIDLVTSPFNSPNVDSKPEALQNRRLRGEAY